MHSGSIEQMILKGRAVVKRLAQDLHIAESSWAQYEAINGEVEDSRRDLREAASRLGVSFAGLRAALLRDTLSALSRVLDDPKSCSLSNVAKTLSKGELKKYLIQEVAGAEWRRVDIAQIGKSVPLQWGKTKPPDSALYEWRKSLEPLRDKMLAHSDLDGSGKVQGMNFVRDGLTLVAELVRAAERTFNGAAPSSSFGDLKRHANVFWDYAQVGFIEARLRDEHVRIATPTHVGRD
jgi:hypothetical protein